MTPRERTLAALRHEQPDRVPVDFLATPEIWDRLAKKLGVEQATAVDSAFSDPTWNTVLKHFEVDCRLFSYDQFITPPDHLMKPGASEAWWDSLSRSTPNRMWRQKTPDGTYYDIWGHHLELVKNPTGAHEQFVSWPLREAKTVEDLKKHPWPDPDWWDFTPLPELMRASDAEQEYHLRFRIGSVFEIGWQLRGMQEFLMDLSLKPEIPMYIMERLADVYVENTKRVLDLVADRLDMVYIYDDVATQIGLMISPDMWRKYVRPHHERILEVAKSYDMPVMFHCDGSIYALIPELIDLGVDLLNPVQADATNMDPQRLKEEFGDRLCFHGGIDIIKTLRVGTEQEVQEEVKDRIRVLGKDGGYILASSHHIQSDTPIENVFAMYDVGIRNEH